MGTRKSNLIYRLRQKGFKIDTSTRTIYITELKDVNSIQVKKLRTMYNFKIQMIF